MLIARNGFPRIRCKLNLLKTDLNGTMMKLAGRRGEWIFPGELDPRSNIDSILRVFAKLK